MRKLFFFLIVFLILSCGRNGRFPWVFSSGEIGFPFLSIEDIDNDGKSEVVGVTTCNKIFALNGENGSVLWKQKVGECRCCVPFSELTDEYSPAFIGDINNDGKKEIILHYNGEIFALNGEDGSLLWSFQTSSKEAFDLVITDVNEDGNPEVITTDTGGFVYCLRGEDGSLLWSYTTPGIEGWVNSSPTVGDIDNDGKVEVIFGTKDNKIYALNAEDGAVLWIYDYDIPEYSWDFTFHSSSSIKDINGDGKSEVIVNTGNCVILKGEDGSLLWSYSGGCLWTKPPIIDLDNDGELELIVPIFMQDKKEILALKGKNGSEKWVFYIRNEETLPCFPVVENIDEDKELEILFLAEDKKLYAIDGKDGSLLWAYEINNPEYVEVCDLSRLPIIGDLNNDGRNEIIFGADKLYILNGENGSLIWSYTTHTSRIQPYTIIDLNQDGKLDILFGTSDGKIYAITPDL
jgi:outer membrane protein assembly factor BamB